MNTSIPPCVDWAYERLLNKIAIAQIAGKTGSKTATVNNPATGVMTLRRSAHRVVKFYTGCGTAEQ